MVRYARFMVAIITLIFCCACAASATGKRVLVVTTEQQTPKIWQSVNGEYVITDLIAAGYPFDLVTYGKFVTMPLDNYDIIILNGHTTPTSVDDVAAKCQSAMQDGRKIFVNGSLPQRQNDANGSLVKELKYVYTLFNVINGGWRRVTGTSTLPASIEKDPDITAYGLQNYSVQTYTFNTPPAMTVSYNGYVVGFLYPQGGHIDSSCGYTLHLLDYGKVVSYLRYGDPAIVGFANDRIEGKPIASFEVHCDTSSDLVAIDALDSMAADIGVRLTNLLVYGRLTPASIAKWNTVSSPYMLMASHSKTHPKNWPPLPDIYFETRDAITIQRTKVPTTQDYLNFSGAMDPTPAQLEQIDACGIAYGGAGFEQRIFKLFDGTQISFQNLPTNWDWFYKCALTNAPFCPSQTIDNDILLWQLGRTYLDELKTNFSLNAKYGIYNYGYFHDYMMNPANNYYVNGTHMSVWIRQGMEYLKSQGAAFVSTNDLTRRLRDYLTGEIDYVANPDGSLTVTVTRPNALANEMKIGFKGDLAPTVTGSSVQSQHWAPEMLYVTLKPEVTSTVVVSWSLAPPQPPVVTVGPYISNLSTANWCEPVHPEGVAEYQYAVGTAPGGTQAQDWTSAGTFTSATLAQAILVHSGTYYVSVRARYEGSDWSEPGVSDALIADLTPPSTPQVIDDGMAQQATSYIHARWSSADPESGVVEYKYAVGATPGADDIYGWTSTTGTEANVAGLELNNGVIYYFSVKSRNAANLWSSTGSSDGLLINSGSMTIGAAKRLEDGAIVYLSGNIVTAAFPGEFYIESPDRSAGVKVMSGAPVSCGDKVDITGAMDTDSVERVVSNTAVTPTGTGTIRPIFMRNKDLGGNKANSPAGPKDGVGPNNVGLLIKTSGKVVQANTNCLIIDDGSEPGLVKVMMTVPHSITRDQYVVVAGIVSLELTPTDFLRFVRTRSNSDVQIVQ